METCCFSSTLCWQPKDVNKVALLRINCIIGDDDDEDDEAEGGTGKRAAEDDDEEVSLRFLPLKSSDKKSLPHNCSVWILSGHIFQDDVETKKQKTDV